MGRSLSALRVELAGRILFERQNLEMAVGALGFPEQGRGREEKSLPGVRAQVVAEMGVNLRFKWYFPPCCSLVQPTGKSWVETTWS